MNEQDYQEALRKPGISPLKLNSLNTIRETLKFVNIPPLLPVLIHLFLIPLHLENS